MYCNFLQQGGIVTEISRVYAMAGGNTQNVMIFFCAGPSSLPMARRGMRVQKNVKSSYSYSSSVLDVAVHFFFFFIK